MNRQRDKSRLARSCVHQNTGRAGIRQRIGERSNRGGLTLIELILALALSAMVLAAIGMAIDLHLRSLKSRRGHVEQAQLARAVLRLIASDLRSSVQYTQIDFSGVEQLALGSEIPSEEGEEEELPPLEEGSETDSIEEDLSEPESVASSTAPPVEPGLYGNQFELQVDVSRLPRVDEYDPALGADLAPTDIPSDTKTVGYFIQTGQGTGTVETGISDPAITSFGGLIRRRLDRATAVWATENGSVVDGATGEMIAPEVKSLEFAYFDGTEWLLEWDSAEQGGLPTAVRITIGLAEDNASINNQATVGSPGLAITSQTEEVALKFYSLTVYLPAAEVRSGESETSETEEANEDSEEEASEESGPGEAGTGGATSGGATSGQAGFGDESL